MISRKSKIASPMLGGLLIKLFVTLRTSGAK